MKQNTIDVLSNILRIVGKVVGAVVVFVLVVAVIVNVYSMIVRSKDDSATPTLFGLSLAVVKTGSMRPTIEVGDCIITLAKKQYKVGDIVMYATEGTPVTHRIVKVDDTTYTTRGDANNSDDTPILHQNVIGKVVIVLPGFGGFINMMRSAEALIAMIFFLIIVACWPVFKKAIEDAIYIPNRML